MVGKGVLLAVVLGLMMVLILFSQDTAGWLYPWSNDWGATTVPRLDEGRNLPPPSAADGHPKGVSPFGVIDAE